MLIDVDRYRTITADTTTPSASVEAAIAEAHLLLTDALGRPVVSEERTEVCTFEPDGTIYPICTPVTAVDGGYQVVDNVVYGCTPDDGPVGMLLASEPRVITLTYTGGFDPDAATGDVDQVPGYMAHDLAWCAWQHLNPGTPLPAGVSSASLGDASVSYAQGQEPGAHTDRFGWSAKTLRWKVRGL